MNSYVLDPRPETELIIEEVLYNIKDKNQKLKILDVGTGSGCLAISLANEFKNSKITNQIILPIDGLSFPKRASRLPNAPRSYRSGTHRGIDFFSNWGTPVRSVADGIIIRSDINYKEMSADFRIEMLKRASLINRTPSDIFNELLLGQAVIIDHGLGLFPGYRSISIYAHLSSIIPKFETGYNIKSGEIFGYSGNTGTRAATAL